MKALYRTLGLLILLSTVFWGASCAAPGSSEPDVAVSTFTQPPTATSTATLTPTLTPVPTARPLMEPVEETGIYQDTTLGVSLEYPSTWHDLTTLSDETLLFVINPERSIFVLLETTILDPTQQFRGAAQSYFEYLTVALDLASSQWATEEADYDLDDGTSAWWGIGEGVSRDSQGTIHYEVVAVNRDARAFFLSMIGEQPDYRANQTALENTRLSLRVYPPRPYGLERQDAFFLAGSEPRTLDPAKFTGDPGWIIGDLFSGLVQLDVNMQPIPDLAERWELSPDGITYTFYLRQNVFFHDGRPFTAEDVEYSWDRASNPDTESDTALAYLGDIVGVPEVLRGEADRISGVQVIDDHTLQVTIDAPKAYFLSKLTYPTSWIVDRETAEDIEEHPIGTGPFKMLKHVKDEIIILARNSQYHRGFVPLEYLVYLLDRGPTVRLYEAGEIDRVMINDDLLGRAEDPSDPLFGTVHSSHELCTHYLAFDLTRPPFDDRNVRRAFAMSIDKDHFNEVAWEGKGIMASGLYPPRLPGFNSDLVPLTYDPEEARRVLGNSSYPSLEDLPEIVFTTGGAGSDLYPSDALVIQMFQDVLGVSVKVEQLDSRTFYEEVISGKHGHIVSLGWCADYPDPENFADLLFHSESRQNIGGYRNTDLDRLLTEARSEEDVANRISLYQEIEQLLVDDVAAAFLDHGRPYYLILKPYVQGYVSVPVGVAQHMNITISNGKREIE